MPHACHRFWKWHKTLSVLLTFEKVHIPCACHAKRHLNVQKWSEPLVFCTLWLRNVLRATTACIFSTSQLWSVFTDHTLAHPLNCRGGWWPACPPSVAPGYWARVWRMRDASYPLDHTGPLDISTSKSGPNQVRFAHFDLEMCFAPQRLQFFISHLASGLAPPLLASLLFDPPEPQIIGKNAVFRDFPTFSCTCIFFLSDSFSSLIFSLLLFSSLWLFPSLLFICPYVGSLTSKLPLIIVRIPKLLPQVISNISRQVLAATTPFFKGAVHKSVSATFQNTTVFPDCFHK